MNHFINPNFVSPSPNVPNGAGPAPTGFGNIPRNAFRGPFQQNWDFPVAKTFRFLERHQFWFRADFFNLFNHPVFRFPSASTSSSVDAGAPATFAQITETVLPARLIQFGLRYSF